MQVVLSNNVCDFLSLLDLWLPWYSVAKLNFSDFMHNTIINYYHFYCRKQEQHEVTDFLPKELRCYWCGIPKVAASGRCMKIYICPCIHGFPFGFWMLLDDLDTFFVKKMIVLMFNTIHIESHILFADRT
jgi:hypothetical protein